MKIVLRNGRELVADNLNRILRSNMNQGHKIMFGLYLYLSYYAKDFVQYNFENNEHLQDLLEKYFRPDKFQYQDELDPFYFIYFQVKKTAGNKTFGTIVFVVESISEVYSFTRSSLTWPGVRKSFFEIKSLRRLLNIIAEMQFDKKNYFNGFYTIDLINTADDFESNFEYLVDAILDLNDIRKSKMIKNMKALLSLYLFHQTLGHKIIFSVLIENVSIDILKNSFFCASKISQKDKKMFSYGYYAQVEENNVEKQILIMAVDPNYFFGEDDFFETNSMVEFKYIHTADSLIRMLIGISNVKIISDGIFSRVLPQKDPGRPVDLEELPVIIE